MFSRRISQKTAESKKFPVFFPVCRERCQPSAVHANGGRGDRDRGGRGWLSRRRGNRRDGGGGGRAMPASRLWLPQRERGLRRGLRGRARGLRRTAAGGDARDGAQEFRQDADAEGRRARGSRLPRRQPEPEIPEGEGLQIGYPVLI